MSDRDQHKTDPIGAVHTRAKELEAHILEHSRDAEAGETVAGGYAARGTARPENSGKSNSKKRSDDLISAVIDSNAEIQRQLKQLYADREALYDQLSDIEYKIDKLDQTIHRMNDGDMPDIGPDGKLVDAELEAMIAAEEKRLGRSIDRSDPQALMVIFTAEQERSTVERDEVLEAIDKNEAEIEAIEQGRDLSSDHKSGIEVDAALESSNGKAHDISDQITVDTRLDQFTF
ncbi:hypothetical protein [Pyruvatibacter mobilis]|uniref:hypothetical protein n=1 Tax=Pyruvatibacter mobilis TaxID=1712261 RepID=UPI003BAD1E52